MANRHTRADDVTVEEQVRKDAQSLKHRRRRLEAFEQSGIYEVLKAANIGFGPEITHSALRHLQKIAQDVGQADTSETPELRFSLQLEDRQTHFELVFYVAEDFLPEIMNSLQLFPTVPVDSKLIIVGNNPELAETLKQHYGAGATVIENI